MAESKSKSNVSTFCCFYCDKDPRCDRGGKHILNNHFKELCNDNTFIRALELAVAKESETLFWHNRDWCFHCGASFKIPVYESYGNNPDVLKRKKDINVEKHFTKYKEHADKNIAFHANLLKEIRAKQAEPKQPLLVSDTEELIKLKREMDIIKKENEKLKKTKEKLQASNNAFLDTFELIPNFFKKALNCNEEQQSKAYDYFQGVKDIYLKQHLNELDEDEAETMIQDVEIPDSLLVNSEEKPKNTLHSPEAETLENAYKYGYQKDDDQHSDGVYEGDIDLNAWRY